MDGFIDDFMMDGSDDTLGAEEEYTMDQWDMQADDPFQNDVDPSDPYDGTGYAEQEDASSWGIDDTATGIVEDSAGRTGDTDSAAGEAEELRFGALDRWGRPYWPSSGDYYSTHE